LARLDAFTVDAFVVAECRRRGIASAKSMVGGLRALLKFAYLNGWTPRPLASVVPAVADRSGGSLPRGLDPADVARLLSSCARDTAVGARDFAILTVLARLGLRSNEVALLELSDVDWRAGEIQVRGKGNRLERLPVPRDVGDALVDYLRRGRPRALCRQLFLRSCAPPTALSSTAVSAVVRAACRRAGVTPVGAHCLRHSVAAELLRRGAPLAEIGQLLRHKHAATTAIYAKVDRGALTGLALEWPGGRS
jgi:site-specific recombinase XerD